MFAIGVSSFFFIVISNFNKLGTLKTQSLKLLKETSFEYEMTRTTLPVHFFTEFTKFEVTNRMECLLNKVPQPCMQFCETVTAKHPTYRVTDTWNCYEDQDVPNRLYGRSKCNTLYPPPIDTTNAPAYLACLRENEVPLAFKEVCNLMLVGDPVSRFSCYQGCLPGVSTADGCDAALGVPPDFDYCALQAQVQLLSYVQANAPAQ